MGPRKRWEGQSCGAHRGSSARTATKCLSPWICRVIPRSSPSKLYCTETRTASSTHAVTSRSHLTTLTESGIAAAGAVGWSTQACHPKDLLVLEVKDHVRFFLFCKSPEDVDDGKSGFPRSFRDTKVTLARGTGLWRRRRRRRRGPGRGRGLWTPSTFPVSHFDSPLGRTVSGVIMKKKVHFGCRAPPTRL